MFLNPEADLSLCAPVLGADIIDILSRHREPAMVDDLAQQFYRRDKRRTAAHFYETIEFLYIVGVIEHHAYHIYLTPEEKQRDLFAGVDP